MDTMCKSRENINSIYLNEKMGNDVIKRFPTMTY